MIKNHWYKQFIGAIRVKKCGWGLRPHPYIFQSLPLRNSTEVEIVVSE
jgi:hypothetical protein